MSRIVTARPFETPCALPIPEVSVVIAYHAAARWLPMQLEALATQRGAPRFEVIIADNEGSSELPGLVAPFEDRLDIRIVDATARRGCGAARNQGAESARGMYLAFCDADDIVDQSWLSIIARPVIDSDVLSGGSLRLDIINEEFLWRVGIGAQTEQQIERPVLQIPFRDFNYHTFTYDGNSAIRKSTFMKLGEIGENFLHGGEDIDFSWRCAESGTPVVISSEAVIHYRLRATSRAIFRQHFSYGQANVDIWIASREMGRPVSGMSLRWTLTETVKLIPQGLRSLNGGKAERYSFSGHAGDILGNLRGQMEQRVLPKLRPRLWSSHLDTPETHR